MGKNGSLGIANQERIGDALPRKKKHKSKSGSSFPKVSCLPHQRSTSHNYASTGFLLKWSCREGKIKIDNIPHD